MNFITPLACAGIALSAQPGLAQSGSEAETAAMGNDIIVTAQRRSQNLIDVPLSIQALSGAQLQERGLDNLTSLQFATPGYFPDTNNGFVQIYMRGIGNAVFVGADPSVATFIDDVPQIYGAMMDNLPDIQRIEVLKGAQGGLYGRNATGGVVNIITRQPDTDALRANFNVSFGERNTVHAGAFLNVPISDKFAWSITAARDTHDAYIQNIAAKTPYSAANFPDGSFVGTPEETAAFFNSPQFVEGMDFQDFWSVRSKFLIKPTDNFSLTLSGGYAKKTDNSSGQFVSSTPEFNQAALLGLFGSMGINAVLPAGFIPGNGGQKWTTSIGSQNYSHIQDYSFSATATLNTDNFDLTSITAYRNMETSTRGDAATSAVPFIPLAVEFGREYYYQEFRLVSAIEGPLRYLAGVTYLDNRLNGDTTFFLFSPTIPAGATTVSQKIRNWSVYGELGYNFTDLLSLTVSGRYMHEKNDAHFTRPVESGSDSTQKKFVPAATLSYELENGGNVYARWAQGFKTGGVNILTAPAYFPEPTDGSTFGPETVNTYEAGVKIALLDRRLQLTGAVFYNDYRDLQVDVRARPGFPAIGVALINAKSARTWGVEGSANFRIVPELNVGVNAGYLNAEYKDFQLSGSTVLNDFDLSGERMPKAPEWQLSFTADLDQPISDSINFAASVLASYTSDVIFKYSAYPDILPNATGDAYWLVNARMGVRLPDNSVGLFLVVDNLFDQEHFVGADASTYGNLLNYGQRRIVKAELSYSF